MQFTVLPAEPAASIVNRLQNAGLIRSSLAARVYLKFKGLDQKLRPGEYELSSSESLESIISKLSRGPKDIKITIPEGWRREQIAERLSVSIKNFDAREFILSTASLEGQLFPDTYHISPTATVPDIIAIMTRNFFQKSGLELPKDKDVLIIASLVEREANTDADRPTVAGIITKRLEAGWPLEIDATVQYGVNRGPDWWKPIYNTKVPSVYNTYLNPGLPPAPISNPGLASILAALHPQETAYWFYITGNDGITRYARTLSEHNLNIDKYLLP